VPRTLQVISSAASLADTDIGISGELIPPRTVIKNRLSNRRCPRQDALEVIELPPRHINAAPLSAIGEVDLISAVEIRPGRSAANPKEGMGMVDGA